MNQEKKVGEKEGWQFDVLKIEGHTKVGREVVRVKKCHAGIKVGKAAQITS
jgi:hypothetical protein